MELIQRVKNCLTKSPSDATSNDEEIIVRKDACLVNLDKTKEITISSKKYEVSPKQLIRMIKNITQTIGEYKKTDNPMSAYAIHALRKARNDVSADLENTFRIHTTISESGRTEFSL